jgi:two-component system, sensor histidine kinase and response regulator
MNLIDQGKGHLILVVDDVVANVRLLVEVLRDRYRVAVAMNGPAAIQRIREQRPDLILLDVMMPGMDGFEVCKRLKMSLETSSIPVIFVTSRREVVDEKRGFDLGAVDYITKPVRAAIVLARVRAQLELADQGRYLDNLVHKRTQDLQNALALASREGESKSAFLANMTHELRTPINGVLGCLSALEHLSPGPDEACLIQMAKKSGLHLNGMVDRLLKLSALDAGQWRPATISFEPRKELTHLEQVFRHAARNKGLAFSWEIDPDIPERVTGCRDALVHALCNILLNAVQFTEQGEIICRIECDDLFPFLPPDSIMLHCIVCDTGPGIAPGMLERIFDPFEIGEPYLTKSRSGAGIGLAVAKRLLKEGRGQIWVESEEGVGSVFTITLPMACPSGSRPDPREGHPSLEST